MDDWPDSSGIQEPSATGIEGAAYDYLRIRWVRACLNKERIRTKIKRAIDRQERHRGRRAIQQDGITGANDRCIADLRANAANPNGGRAPRAARHRGANRCAGSVRNCKQHAEHQPAEEMTGGSGEREMLESRNAHGWQTSEIWCWAIVSGT